MQQEKGDASKSLELLSIGKVKTWSDITILPLFTVLFLITSQLPPPLSQLRSLPLAEDI